ncbi:alpha/beta hydrolase [Leifsonia sp. LS1]|uniref:alpha/beta fold hydrolase n=1 Tax=Leifsonia sp. LS1 TaxID=2828483 RepID=UPI001CFDBAB2|nr:alpha/beta hydrolase [Leifsonia sp. LS1]GIT79397.1 alpha/beta hydrolase [Leifsonia sp. LS1]
MATVTSADGTHIAYETAGAGPAMVLVDGASCHRASGPMRPIAAALARRLTAVAYDRRGRGESGDTLPFAVGREIEDIAALIDAIGGPVTLFGISSGGALALTAAAALGPELVDALVVYEPPYVPEGAQEPAQAYTAALHDALARGDRDAAVELFFRRVGVPEDQLAGLRQSPFWSGTVGLAPTLAYDDAALGDSLVPDEVVAALRVPVLGLAGGATPEFLRYGAATIAAEAVDGHYAELPGQTHAVEADALAPVLTDFVASAR